MIFRPVLLLFALSVLIFANAETNTAPKEIDSGLQPIQTAENISSSTETVPTDKPKPSTTSEKPTPDPTTQSTSSTAGPTTSTAAPTTSTAAPTTTKQPTTTAAPTSTKQPTTTAAPTVAPTTAKPPSDWVVVDNNTVCIIANMEIKVTVPYKSNNNTNVSSEFHIKYNEGVTASGSCGAHNETLILHWGNGTATFLFTHEANKTSYSLSNVTIVINVSNATFPDNTMTNVSKIAFVNDAEVFSVKSNHSYTCALVKALNLNGTAWNSSAPTNVSVPAILTLTSVRAEAFKTGNDTKFSAALDCASDKTPDYMPIVVGLILAGLVIVVLIAYLVGRRRAQSRGYLSM